MTPRTRRATDSDSSLHRYHGNENKTSTTLLIRLKNGEAFAWERFVSLYSPLIRFWCRKSKNKLNRQERQDVLQEVLQKVHKSIDTFDHENRLGRHFRAWLRKITENHIIDTLREKDARKEVSQLMSDTGHIKWPQKRSGEDSELQEEPTERLLLLKQVLKTIETEFSEKHRDVFNLLIVAEKDSTEVAGIMGMNAPAVRKIKSRIIKRLREEYALLGLDDELPDSLAPPG